MMHRKKRITLTIGVSSAVVMTVLLTAVVYLKITYDRLEEMGRELMWMLNEDRIDQAHRLFDEEAGRLFTAQDMALVDGQMDRLIGRSGKWKWTGTMRFTTLSPLTAVITWKAPFSLAKEPVAVTLSFIKRDGAWGIGGLWYDCREVRETPLLVSLRLAGEIDENLKPKEVASDFDAGAGGLYAWTLWQSLNGDHVVAIHWTDPSGAELDEFAVDVSRKPERKSRIIYTRLDFGEWGGTPPEGAWKVHVLLDSKKIAETQLTIRSADGD